MSKDGCLTFDLTRRGLFVCTLFVQCTLVSKCKITSRGKLQTDRICRSIVLLHACEPQCAVQCDQVTHKTVIYNPKTYLYYIIIPHCSRIHGMAWHCQSAGGYIFVWSTKRCIQNWHGHVCGIKTCRSTYKNCCIISMCVLMRKPISLMSPDACFQLVLHAACRANVSNNRPSINSDFSRYTI